MSKQNTFFFFRTLFGQRERFSTWWQHAFPKLGDSTWVRCGVAAAGYLDRIPRWFDDGGGDQFIWSNNEFMTFGLSNAVLLKKLGTKQKLGLFHPENVGKMIQFDFLFFQIVEPRILNQFIWVCCPGGPRYFELDQRPAHASNLDAASFLSASTKKNAVCRKFFGPWNVSLSHEDKWIATEINHFERDFWVKCLSINCFKRHPKVCTWCFEWRNTLFWGSLKLGAYGSIEDVLFDTLVITFLSWVHLLVESGRK